jgi:hypothetical protein
MAVFEILFNNEVIWDNFISARLFKTMTTLYDPIICNNVH